MIIFKIYDVVNWEANNYSRHTVEYFKKGDYEVGSANRRKHEKYIYIFEKSYAECGEKASSKPFSKSKY